MKTNGRKMITPRESEHLALPYPGDHRVICSSSGQSRPLPSKGAGPYDVGLGIGRGDSMLLKSRELVHVRKTMHVHRPSLMGIQTRRTYVPPTISAAVPAADEDPLREMLMANCTARDNHFQRMPCLGMTTQHFFSPASSRLELPKESFQLFAAKTRKKKTFVRLTKQQNRLAMYSTQRVFAVPGRVLPEPLRPVAVYATGMGRAARPRTGTGENEGVSREEDEAEPCRYPGTAYRMRRDKLMMTQQLVKPQTVPEHRPDSRYNKETLCAVLENGRSHSPDYKVPVLPMNLQPGTHHVLLPSCWT